VYGGDDDECSAGYGSDQLYVSAHASRPAALNIVSNTSPTDYCSAAAAVSQPQPAACLPACLPAAAQQTQPSVLQLPHRCATATDL